MSLGSRSKETGNSSGNAEGDQPQQVRLIKLFTTPTRSRVYVGGHDSGVTKPTGLSVPWNGGEISIRRFLYKTTTLNFHSEPSEAAIHVELEPALPFKQVGIAAACCVLIAVLVFFLYPSVTRHEPVASGMTLSIQTDPGEVSVYLANEKTPAGKSDSAGKASIPVPDTGPFSLRFERDYFAAKTMKIAPKAFGPRDSLRVSLKRIKTDMAITTEPGFVHVAVDGDETGTTDSKGSLLLKGMPVDKQLKIVFRREGYHSLTRRVSADAVDIFRLGPVALKAVQSGPAVTPPPEARPSVPKPEIIEAPPKPIEFVIKTDPGVVHISGLAGQQEISGTSDKRGKLSVAVQEPGKLHLTFRKDYFRPHTKEYDLTQANARDFPKVVLKRTHGDLIIKTDPGGVHVNVDGTHRGASDESGTLKISRVPVGRNLHLQFTKDGFPSETREVELSDQESAILGPVKLAAVTPPKRQPASRLSEPVVPPKPRPPVSMPREHVKLPETELILDVGEPGVFISVVHEGGQSFGMTNPKGKFGVARLPMGKQIYVSLKKKGWQPKALDPIVFTAENPSILKKLTMVREGTEDPPGRDRPAGADTDEPGETGSRKPGSARVALAPSGCDLVVRTIPPRVEVLLADGRTATSDGRGRLVLRNVPPGEELRLRFKKTGYHGEEKTFEVPSVATHELEPIELRRIVTELHLDTNVARANVSIRVGSRKWPSETDADGRLTVYGLPMGEPLIVKIEKDDYQTKTLEPFAFSTEQSTRTFSDIKLERLDERRN